jgi:hypothetical protein
LAMGNGWRPSSDAHMELPSSQRREKQWNQLDEQFIENSKCLNLKDFSKKPA